LEQAIVKGAGSKDFFGTANGQAGENYDGFKFDDANVQLDETLLLIEAGAAAEYAASIAKPAPEPEAPIGGEQPSGGGTTPVPTGGATGSTELGGTAGGVTPPPTQPAKSKAFYGSIEINPATAKMGMVQVADEIINLRVGS
jgi:hypothetical protein